MNTTAVREQWSSRLGFILVAAGAAAGLGNVWKFPYIVGENGGGAFMLVYLATILAVGLPILAAELLLGRLGNRNVIDSFTRVASASGRSRHWSIIGWIGLAAVFIVLSFYRLGAGSLAPCADGSIQPGKRPIVASLRSGVRQSDGESHSCRVLAHGVHGPDRLD
ncbi:MAG: hypothetical protein ACR2PS_17900 [Pseudomonadales bacterium]